MNQYKLFESMNQVNSRKIGVTVHRSKMTLFLKIDVRLLG